MSSTESTSPKESLRRRLGAGALLLALSVSLAGALAQDAPPQPASAAASAASAPSVNSAAADVPRERYQIHEFDWRDELRGRPVPARLYWPAAAQGNVPLVVFSHGLGGSRAGYSYLGAYWASQGIASLHVQHVGSDRALWSGNPLRLMGRLQDATRDDEALGRVRDVRFALDQLLMGAWGPRIDATHIAAAGHSYGANTSLLLAGAQVQREGRVLPLRDERISAAIIISAPPFYGEGDPASILQPIQVPTLHITATEDVIRVPGRYSDAEDRLKVFEAIGGAVKQLAVFQGGSHSIFTDRTGSGGASLNPKVKAATRDLTLAFLQRQFGLRDDDALPSLAERHAALLARWCQAAQCRSSTPSR